MNGNTPSSISRERARQPSVKGPAQEPPPRRSASLDAEQSAILQLQRTAGNAAVAELLAARPKVQRRRGAIAPDPHAPERTSVDVTGFYEVIDHGAGNRITLQINQAGRHIEGWWQQHRGHGYGEQEDLITNRIAGDLSSDHEGSLGFDYQRFDSGGKQATEGLLTAWMEGDDINLQLIEGSWGKSFKRTDEAPRISDEAISAMPGEVKALVTATQEVPLDETEQAIIEDAARLLYGAASSAITPRAEASDGPARQARST